MAAHVLLQHSLDTLIILVSAVTWPWLVCFGALISNNNRIRWQVVYKQHSFILTWLLCRSLSFSQSSPFVPICHLHLSPCSYSFFFLVTPAIDRNAFKGAFCSCKICKYCLSLSAFFWSKSPFFFACLSLWWLSHAFFFFFFFSSSANFRLTGIQNVEHRNNMRFEEIFSNQGLWKTRLGDGEIQNDTTAKTGWDKVELAWGGKGYSAAGSRVLESHMTGGHMLLSFVYTPHIAVQQQHVHTVKQTLKQSVWLISMCVQ